MKKRLKNTIALVIVMSVILSIVAIPVHAEAGLSEAMRLDSESDLFDVLLFILLLPSIIFTTFVLIVETIVEFVAHSMNL